MTRSDIYYLLVGKISSDNGKTWTEIKGRVKGDLFKENAIDCNDYMDECYRLIVDNQVVFNAQSNEIGGEGWSLIPELPWTSEWSYFSNKILEISDCITKIKKNGLHHLENSIVILPKNLNFLGCCSFYNSRRVRLIYQGTKEQFKSIEKEICHETGCGDNCCNNWYSCTDELDVICTDGIISDYELALY